MKKYQAQIREVKVGENVKIVEPCNLYECELGDSKQCENWQKKQNPKS